MSRLVFLCLKLRLKPVLVRLAIVVASLLVDFIGPLCDLRFEIFCLPGQQWSLSRVENPIGEQFHD
jgi:hypothetical protein